MLFHPKTPYLMSLLYAKKNIAILKSKRYPILGNTSKESTDWVWIASFLSQEIAQ